VSKIYDFGFGDVSDLGDSPMEFSDGLDGVTEEPDLLASESVDQTSDAAASGSTPEQTQALEDRVASLREETEAREAQELADLNAQAAEDLQQPEPVGSADTGEPPPDQPLSVSAHGSHHETGYDDEIATGPDLSPTEVTAEGAPPPDTVVADIWREGPGGGIERR
jgi:hypothetical protein